MCSGPSARDVKPHAIALARRDERRVAAGAREIEFILLLLANCAPRPSVTHATRVGSIFDGGRAAKHARHVTPSRNFKRVTLSARASPTASKFPTGPRPPVYVPPPMRQTVRYVAVRNCARAFGSAQLARELLNNKVLSRRRRPTEMPRPVSRRRKCYRRVPIRNTADFPSVVKEKLDSQPGSV